MRHLYPLIRRVFALQVLLIAVCHLGVLAQCSPSVFISSNASGNTACSGQTVTFTANPSADLAATAPTYQFTVNLVNVGTNTSTNTYSTSSLNNGDVVNVIAYPTTDPNSCGYVIGTTTVGASPITMTINNPISISSNPANTTICAGSSTALFAVATGTGLSYQWKVNTGSGWTNVSNGAPYSGATSSTLIISNATAAMDQYQYEVDITTTGVCSPTTVTSNFATLTVNSPVTITSNPSSTSVCSGNLFSFSVGATGSNLQYAWSYNSGSGWNSIGPNAAFLTNMASSLQNGYQYRCTVIGSPNACSQNFATSGAATLSVGSAITFNNNTHLAGVCTGMDTSFSVNVSGTGLTYQWKVNNGSGFANVSNNATYSGATTPVLTITNPTASMDSYYYEVVVTSSGACAPTTATSTASLLRVSAVPVITLNPADQASCSGTLASFSVGATGNNLGYAWQVNNGTGWSSIGSSNSTLFVFATPSSNGYQYRCIVFSSGFPNYCFSNNATSNAATLTVSSPITIINDTHDATVCAGIDTSFSVSASGSNLSYQWAVNTGSGFTNITNNSTYGGATTSTLTISSPTAALDSAQYRVTISSTGACSPSSVNSISSRLRVSSVPVITSNPSNASVCAGSPAFFTVTATGTGLGYLWQVNDGTGWTTAGGSTNTLAVFGAYSSNGYQYRCLVFSNPSTCNPNYTMSGAANLAVSNPAAIVSSPSNSTICAGNNTSFSVGASGSVLSYQWQVNTGSGYTNVSNSGVYSGATNSTLNITGATTSMNGYQYQAIVTSGGVCTPPTATSAAATLGVNTTAAFTSQPSNASVCAGSNAIFSVTATGTGVSYQWYVNTGSGFTSISNTGVYSGATSSTLTIAGATASMNNYLYQCQITGGGVCSPTTYSSNTATLSVSSPAAITSNPSNTTICVAGTAYFNVTATGTGLSYQWQVNSGSGFTNLTNAGVYSGATSNALTITGVTSNMSGNVFRCVVTSAGVCTPSFVTSNNATLTTNDLATVTSQPSASTICAGSSTSYSISATGTGITYQWQVNTGSGFVTLTNTGAYSGVTTNTLNITTATASMDGYLYNCVVTSSGVCVPASTTSNSAILNVNTPATVTVNPVNSTICAGSNTSFAITATGTSLSYQWQVNTGSGFANVTNTGVYTGATGNTLNLTSAPASMNGYVYQCIVTSAGVCTPPTATSGSATLNVNLPATVTADPASVTICSGSNTTFSVGATGTGLSYQWQVNTGSGFVNLTNTGVYTGATTNALTITGATISMNGYLYQCLVTSSGVCVPATVSSNSATLNINLPATVTANPSSVTICIAGNASFAITATGTGITYQWQVNTGSGFVNVTNTGVYTGATTNTLNITGATASMDAYVYHCVVTSSGVCVPAFATSANATLNMNTPVAIGTNPTNATVCATLNTTFSVAATGTGLSYQWQVNTGAGFANVTNTGVYTGATSNTLNITGATISMNGYLYQCVVTSSGICVPSNGTSGSASLTVNPQPSQPASFTVSLATVYAGQSVTYTVPNDPTVTYNWSYSGTGATINGTSNSVTVDFNGSATSGTLSVTATTLLGCGPSAARSVAINVLPYETWTGTTSMDWNVGTNWDGGFVPNASTSVLIPSTFNPPIIYSGTSSVYNFTEYLGVVLRIYSGAKLNILHNMSINGFIYGPGYVSFSGSAAQTFVGASDMITNLELNNANGLTVAPSSTLYVTGNYMPTAGVLTTNNSFVLYSDLNNTGTVGQGSGSGYISGNVTAEKYIHGGPGQCGVVTNCGRAYRFIGHPFSSAIALSQLTDDIDISGTGGTANGFTTSVTTTPSSFYLDASSPLSSGFPANDAEWNAFTNTNGSGSNAWNQYEGIRILVRGAKGQGLLYPSVYLPNAATLTMNGPLNQGPQTISLTNNSSGSYNLISNPYPANVDMSLVTRGSSVGPNFVVWDPSQGVSGAYVSQTFSTSYILPAYSAFVATTTASSNNTLSFQESNKTTTAASGNLFKTSSNFGDNTIQLRILTDNDSVSWDRLLLMFDGQAMAQKDDQDAVKFPNPDLNFYTFSSDSQPLSIDVRPYVDGQVVQLGFKTGIEQPYTLRVDDYNVPAGVTLLLHDKYLNQVQTLSKGMHYNFSVTQDPSSQGDNRFELNLSGNPAGISNVVAHNLKVVLSPNPATDNAVLSFEAPESGNTTIRITNLLGQEVFRKEMGNVKMGNVKLPVQNLSGGIYLINVNCGGLSVAERLIKE